MDRDVGRQFSAQLRGNCRNRLERMDLAAQGGEPPREDARIGADIDGDARAIAQQIEQVPFELACPIPAGPKYLEPERHLGAEAF